MRYNSELHHRKSIRLKKYDYSQAGCYFVTICTHNREHLFGKIIDGIMVLNENGEILNDCIQNIHQHFSYSVTDYFCIMPNHIHMIVIINELRPDDIVGNKPVGNRHACSLPGYTNDRNHQALPVIIGSIKSAVTKLIHRINSNYNAIWQKSYYEHIIRNENELFAIRNYIENNPINWGNDEYY